ncbi:MAG TPA: amidohydrolase [Gammaproteobacteria bacterium]|nr:amidohydrolase [Gammaproteobacteria bacterium]
MDRRTFLRSIAAIPVALTGCQYMPREGFFNDCPEPGLPESLANHDLVKATWEGIDTQQVWDGHCHLIGVGDSNSGIWVNPDMQSLWHPLRLTRFTFYLNASCVRSGNKETIDEGAVQRLLDIHADLPEGFRYVLLGFDYHHTHAGDIHHEYSAFHTPNEYALKMAKAHPGQFEWIASIHPYREDALSALQDAVDNHARAIKWLPSVMGIDASDPKCDAFYDALVKHDLPLLTHVGSEYAVDSPSGQTYNNPLLFRRALDHGVRVIFAHCATLGESMDIDKGRHGPRVANLDLFARLIEEPRYENLALGDTAAITQVNRDRWKIEKIIESDEWHDRLIYGSDYPLPGVMPVYSPLNFVDWDMLPRNEAKILSAVRRHNPILFDVILKRRIEVKGKRFKASVFESRRHFMTQTVDAYSARV